MHSPWVWVSILFLLDPQIGRSEAVSYDRDIKPLFAEKCGVCHGALAQEAGLRLDAGELIRKGGDQGRVIIPGRASESRLIRRVTSPDLDERMPPEGEGAALRGERQWRRSKVSGSSSGSSRSRMMWLRRHRCTRP